MAKVIVNVDVPDLEQGIRFYTQAFGLRVGHKQGDYAVFLLGADTPIVLLLAAGGSPPFRGATEKREYRRHWTPVHLDFAVRDIDAAVERAIAAGAKQESPIESYDFGKLSVLSDPFGHGLCLIHFERGAFAEMSKS